VTATSVGLDRKPVLRPGDFAEPYGTYHKRNSSAYGSPSTHQASKMTEINNRESDGRSSKLGGDGHRPLTRLMPTVMGNNDANNISMRYIPMNRVYPETV
jgi:hypothetical protein